MDFARFQDGERKQPDYIMVFREGEKIEHIEDVVQAYNDWGGQLPIVVIDVDKCLESERGKVEEMLEQYQEAPNAELGKQIKQKVENNRKSSTTKEFCSDLQSKIDELNTTCNVQKIETEQTSPVTMEELETNYILSSAEDRKHAMSDLKSLNTRLNKLIESEGMRR